MDFGACQLAGEHRRSGKADSGKGGGQIARVTRVSGLGRVTIRMPTNPITAAITCDRVSRSPRTNGASSITQSGEVNSSAKTCASGITVIE